MLKLNHNTTEDCFLSCCLPLYPPGLHKGGVLRVTRFSLHWRGFFGETRYTWEDKKEHLRTWSLLHLKLQETLKTSQCHHINIKSHTKDLFTSISITQCCELSCISPIDVEFLTPGNCEYDLIWGVSKSIWHHIGLWWSLTQRLVSSYEQRNIVSYKK